MTRVQRGAQAEYEKEGFRLKGVLIVACGPAVAEVKELLSARIACGEFGLGAFLPSVRRLSQESGRSPKTVHRALQGLAEEGLIQADSSRGYRVKALALDPEQGAPVAYVMNSARRRGSDPRFLQILMSELQAAAARRGWNLLIVGGMDASPEETYQQLRSNGVRGVLLDSINLELVSMINADKLPTVMVDAWDPAIDLDAVVQDGYRGGLLAGEHLAEKGGQRIAWLGLDPAQFGPQAVERYSGVVGGLKSRGHQLALEYFVARNDVQSAKKVALKLLSSAQRPSGIAALWQSAFLGVLQAARSLKLKPGRDFELVGWSVEEDLQAIVQAGNSPLTCPVITWRLKDMADTALNRLAERRAGIGIPTIHLRIPTRITEGPCSRERE
jgi:DNA-binding LacI/PurR family transcriptional regulator